ncbi:LysR family transcriptional regulator [Vibrio hannami]|uniref:LysR family transcriptional regulator n=1 Tax=Vibrio hannami TaxID=2717094 RepID=UPI00240F283F|nr:LysR family transcriptional regulator [Vibrio hannami]MDG3085068.1 LysR family transcriptional regulator [Vibrio hannami]
MISELRFNLNRLAYFVAIVEEKTITAAAKRLNLSKAVVSKQLQLLEEELGATLLVRNTRHMHTTDVGQAFYLHSKDLLNQARATFESVIERSKEPSGVIRLTAPVDFGINKLAPFISEFSQRYPNIEIEAQLSDDRLDIVAHRFDLSFRIGWLEDSSNRARKIGTFREVAVGSTTFVDKWQPTNPSDLSKLPFVSYNGIESSHRVFTRDSQEHDVALNSNVTFNVTVAVKEALYSGQHFAILPDFTIQQDIVKGKLIEILPDWKLKTGGIHVVSPPSRLRTRAIQIFLDELTKQDSLMLI